jgi:L-ribulose-5-phosphate 3-epimerase
MEKLVRLSRRRFLAATGALAGAANWSGKALRETESDSAGGQRIPLRIGQRAVDLNMVGNFDVLKVARQVPGLWGVELQVTGGNPNLHDLDAVRRYKKEANLWRMFLPSVAGVWSRGNSVRSAGARSDLIQAVRSAELLGASVILVAFFRHSGAPNMNEESPYGPVVELLQEVAPTAADAGVTLGLETSLSPADNLKLVDFIGRPNVKVYYDVWNMAYYGYSAEAIPGILLLGKRRICQVHVKNNNDHHRIAGPGLVDWAAAFRAFNQIGYEGWYMFEEEPLSFTERRSLSQMIEDTERNIAFLRQHCRMPLS